MILWYCGLWAALCELRKPESVGATEVSSTEDMSCRSKRKLGVGVGVTPGNNQDSNNYYSNVAFLVSTTSDRGSLKVRLLA